METNLTFNYSQIIFDQFNDSRWTNLTNSTVTESRDLEPVFSILGFSLGVFGNVLALIVLVKSSKRHKWKIFYKMITVLSIVDLLGILALSPIVLAIYENDLKWVGGQTLCHFFSFMVAFSSLCTCSIISGMAVDRYIAIVHPFKYRTIPKEKAVRFAIPGILIFSTIVSVLPIVGLGQNVIHWPGSWCFPDFYDDKVETTIFLYVYSLLILLLILVTATLNIRALGQLIVGKRSYVRRDSSASMSKSKRHIDVYIMVLLIVIFVVFAVCWSPFVVRIIICQVKGPPYNKLIDLITLRMASCNQILDPWVYLLFRKESLRRLVAQIYRILPMSQREKALARLFSIASRGSTTIIEPDESFFRNIRKRLSQVDAQDVNAINQDRSPKRRKTPVTVL